MGWSLAWGRTCLGDIVRFTQMLFTEFVPLRRQALTGKVSLTTSRSRRNSPESALDDDRFCGTLQYMLVGATNVHTIVHRPPGGLT